MGTAMTILGALAGLLALAGAVLCLLGARAVRRLAATPTPAGPALPATVLKPLHGAEPGLGANLRASLAQAHAAPFETRFGLADPGDPAAEIARAAMAAVPANASLLVNAAILGPNRKVSQLVHLTAAPVRQAVVVADADMLVPPHWLTAVTAPLAEPGVGLVTCLYHGLPGDGGLWSRLAALGIDWHFLPNAAFGESLGKADGCYGATMALTADTLSRIGGFESLLGLLADDHALGVAVRRLGLRTVVSPVIPAHVMAEPSLAALLGHELRWARTLRLLNPAGYAGLAVTHPLAWGLLATALAGAPGLAVLGLALAARILAAIAIDAALGKQDYARLMLLPLRDALSFAIWAAGLTRRTVLWQGLRYRLRPDGSMVELP